MIEDERGEAGGKPRGVVVEVLAATAAAMAMTTTMNATLDLDDDDDALEVAETATAGEATMIMGASAAREITGKEKAAVVLDMTGVAASKSFDESCSEGSGSSRSYESGSEYESGSDSGSSSGSGSESTGGSSSGSDYESDIEADDRKEVKEIRAPSGCSSDNNNNVDIESQPPMSSSTTTTGGLSSRAAAASRSGGSASHSRVTTTASLRQKDSQIIKNQNQQRRRRVARRTAATRFSPLLLLAAGIFFISFVPILYFREPGEPIRLVYTGAYESRDQKRAHKFKDMVLKLTHQVKEMEAKLAVRKVRSDGFDELQAKAMSVTKELLDLKGRSEVLEKEGADAHRRAKDTSGAQFDRMRALNATFRNAMGEMRKRLETARGQLEKQSKVNERLEGQLEKLRSGEADPQIEQDKEKIKALEMQVKVLTVKLNATIKSSNNLNRPSSNNADGVLIGASSPQEQKPVDESIPPWRTGKNGGGESMKMTPGIIAADPWAASQQHQGGAAVGWGRSGLSGLNRPLGGSGEIIPAAADCDKSRFMFNTDVPGTILSGKAVRSARSCRSMCVANMECEAWSYRRTDGKCFLKANVGAPSASACCIAGIMCSQ